MKILIFIGIILAILGLSMVLVMFKMLTNLIYLSIILSDDGYAKLIKKPIDDKGSLKELKDLNSDWFGSCDIHIEELRLDMQTVKKWINDIVKVVNNGNR